MSFGKDQTGDFGDTLDNDSLNDASVDERALVIREQKVRAQFWDKLKRVAGKIPFVDDLGRRLLLLHGRANTAEGARHPAWRAGLFYSAHRSGSRFHRRGWFWR